MDSWSIMIRNIGNKNKLYSRSLASHENICVVKLSKEFLLSDYEMDAIMPVCNIYLEIDENKKEIFHKLFITEIRKLITDDMYFENYIEDLPFVSGRVKISLKILEDSEFCILHQMITLDYDGKIRVKDWLTDKDYWIVEIVDPDLLSLF